MRTPNLKPTFRRESLLSRLVLPFLLLALPVDAGSAESTAVTPRLQARLAARTTDGEPIPVWVYFRDKDLRGPALDRALADAARALDQRALRRRAKTAAPGTDLVDGRDLPVSGRYIDAVAAVGAAPRERSRWFNAASFDATADEIEAIATLPFVLRVDAVAQGVRRPEPAGDPTAPLPAGGDKAAPAAVFDYGPSWTQMQLANVPTAHDAGWTGAGVVIGVMDGGFRTTHEAFAGLDVIATYDFVNNDTNVDDEPGDPAGAFEHGTKVLSDIVAFSPGHLVSPAFNASVILAKTEDIGDEQPIEEDYWVAGLEWIESLGGDIVSSSLGYYYWYTNDDMDGDTALTTRAADMAAALGVLVITSAGNERGSNWGMVTAPADGDSVVAVGATYDNGVVAYFSSPGPTADGRIKPDVVAMGRGNAMVATTSDTTYTTWSGTSFACPITAGVAALVLEKHPTLTPMQLRDALRETADRADNPDNDYGWGMIDAVAALGYFAPHFVHAPLHDTEDPIGPYAVTCTLTDPGTLVPGSPTLMYRADGGAWQPVPLAPAGGDIWTAGIPGQPLGTLVEYWFTADDELGVTGTLPTDAPASVFAFHVDLDLDSPTVIHDPVPAWPARHWAPPVTATITDNAFVASASVDWTFNGAPQAAFALTDRGDGTWSAPFPAAGPVPAVGDTIVYTITAADGAAVPNTGSSGPHVLPVTDALARVLIVDAAEGGTGPATMAGWLTTLGYDNETITPPGLLTEDLEHYQALILSVGSVGNSPLSSNPAYRAALRAWSESGGAMFVESGNLGIDVYFWDPQFGFEVLRSRGYRDSNGGYFVRQAAQVGHPVLSSPNTLGASMVVAFTPLAQDTMLPAPGADVLYSPYSFPGAAGVLVYDDTPAPQGGQLVYLTADITALWASANADQFFENAMAWLTAVEPEPDCSLAGHVNLVGAPDDGATVKVGRFHETTTSADGTFSLPGMYAGTHAVRVSCPGFEVQLADITLAPGEQRTDADFALMPVEEIIAVNDTVTAIPPSDPLGTNMYLTIGPEHAGKTLADIRVTVDITHNNSGELTLKLSSPSGTAVWLRNHTGGETPDVVGTWPVDLLVDGPGSLDDLLGEPIAGTWRLNVSDDVILTNGEVTYWSLTLGSALDVSDVEDTPTPLRTTLLGNVPNPFNPMTRIAFELARPGHVRLCVYDLRGRLVRTLVDETLAAGRHGVVWDGRDGKGRQSASGVYFSRLQADGFTGQGKMLLVK